MGLTARALSTLIYGIRDIFVAGVEMPVRNAINFGAGFTVTDDPINERVDIGASIPSKFVGTPEPVGQTSIPGAGTTYAAGNHVHAHGAQPIGDGTDHAEATGLVAGFMSAEDKQRFSNMTLYDSTPEVLTTAAGDPGNNERYASGNHRHQVAADPGVDDGIEVTTADGIVSRAADIIGVLNLYVSNIYRKSVGVLGIDGNAGVALKHSGYTVSTHTRPSAGVARVEFGQAATRFVSAIASSTFAWYCEVAEDLVATLSRPASNTAQLEFGQLTGRILNAVPSGQILFRASSASGVVALDGQVISERNESGFGDWATKFNRTTGLNGPTSTLPSRGRYEQQDIDTTNRGQLITLLATGIYEHVMYRGAGKTPRQSIPRQAFNERFNTAGEKLIGTVASTELFDNYGAVADVRWIAHNVTDNTWSAGSFTAVIFRRSGAPWVEDQNPYGIVYDGIAADASAIVALPYLTTSSNDIVLKCETGNTDTIDVTAFVEIFAGQQRTS
jgi:hypothetical protein